MNAAAQHLDAFLRRSAWGREGRPGLPVLHLVALVMVAAGAYGLVMGSYGLTSGERARQLAYSGIKAPLLLFATFVISVPSFAVVNTLVGLRDDLGESVRALLATQAGVSIVLASLAPYTAFWYVSFDNYGQAVLFNAGMFGVASITGQFMLLTYYRPLIARRPRHRWMLPVWLLVYAFVGIQMAWVLRPFIGDPNAPVRFFREDQWGNAYVVVGRLIWSFVSG